MVRVIVVGLVLASSLLPHGSVAVTVIAEKDTVVRREAKPIHMNVDADGEFTQEPESQIPKEEVKMDTDLSQEELDKLAMQYCDQDFPLGQEDTNHCTEANARIMIDPGACIQAGVMAGASVTHATFMVPQGTTDRWEFKRPKGCFKAPCGSASTAHTVCYFYNGLGADAGANVTGTPVCDRPRHANGTQDAQGGCPDGYQVVDDEETCRTSATCLGHAPGNEFRIGTHNASKHLDYVQGCFVNKDDGKVYYNKLTVMGLGTNPTGQNICNVSTTVKW